MQLVYYPDPRLLKVCAETLVVTYRKPSTELKQERVRMAKKMWLIMRKKRGVGLAATQVGSNVRMFVFKSNEYNHAVWNPVLSCVSGSDELEEGCLSLPNINVVVQRATSSILTGQGLNGLPLQFIGDPIMTRIWQHEIDHLDGKLIIDNMSREETLSNKEALRLLLSTTKA